MKLCTFLIVLFLHSGADCSNDAGLQPLVAPINTKSSLDLLKGTPGADLKSYDKRNVTISELHDMVAKSPDPSFETLGTGQSEDEGPTSHIFEELLPEAAALCCAFLISRKASKSPKQQRRVLKHSVKKHEVDYSSASPASAQSSLPTTMEEDMDLASWDDYKCTGPHSCPPWRKTSANVQVSRSSKPVQSLQLSDSLIASLESLVADTPANNDKLASTGAGEACQDKAVKVKAAQAGSLTQAMPASLRPGWMSTPSSPTKKVSLSKCHESTPISKEEKQLCPCQESQVEKASEQELEVEDEPQQIEHLTGHEELEDEEVPEPQQETEVEEVPQLVEHVEIVEQLEDEIHEPKKDQTHCSEVQDARPTKPKSVKNPRARCRQQTRPAPKKHVPKSRLSSLSSQQWPFSVPSTVGLVLMLCVVLLGRVGSSSITASSSHMQHSAHQVEKAEPFSRTVALQKLDDFHDQALDVLPKLPRGEKAQKLESYILDAQKARKIVKSVSNDDYNQLADLYTKLLGNWDAALGNARAAM